MSYVGQALFVTVVLSLMLILFMLKKKHDDYSSFPYLRGLEGAKKLVELHSKYGPLKMVVKPDDSADWFPEGRVLERVTIKEVEFYDIGLSVNVEWEKDRPIRTGILRRILGP